MSDAPEYFWERAGSQHAAELLTLFEGVGNGCYCNYWHFQGDKNAWLERSYLKPEENRAALVERLAGEELCGVVARQVEGGALCGWMKVTPASSVARVYEQRVYKSLPCFQATPDERERTYTVACTLVAEAQRGRGVARVLLTGAIAAARAVGASALEAFPRGLSEGAERLRAEELWMGPETLFREAGFMQVSDFRPYPVLRLHLRPAD
jgi:GNAT superfamily N-acetyltransferase